MGMGMSMPINMIMSSGSHFQLPEWLKILAIMCLVALFVILPLVITTVLVLAIIKGIAPKYYATPSYIYYNSDLNELGTAFVFACLFPFMYPYYIGAFVVWIFQKIFKRWE